MPHQQPWVAFIERASVHDVEGVLALCHPEVRWETRWPGFEPAFRGRAGVRCFFEAFEEAIADVRPEFSVLQEGEDRVLVEMLLKGQGVGSGVPVVMKVFDVWTFRDGLLWRRQTHYDRDEAINVWSAPVVEDRVTR
jgi:ketosteroid isomerase-like protein